MTVLDDDFDSLDMDAISRAKAAAAAGAADGMNFRFSLNDGETDRIRIRGGPGQPHLSGRHWLQRLGRYETCTTGVKGALPCVMCHFQPVSGNSISPAQPCISWTILSDSLIHIIEQKGGPKKVRRCMNQPWFDDAVSCDMCAAGVKRRRNGRLYWDMASLHATTIRTEQEKLSKRCVCGGAIRVTGYSCAGCGDPVPAPGEVRDAVLCQECNQTTKPKATRQCKNPACTNPVARRITDCWIQVRRTGAGTTTMYSLDPEMPSELSVEDQAVKPIDFALMHAKRITAPATLAAQLGFELPRNSPWVSAAEAGGGVTGNSGIVGGDDIPY